jgi:hypothetical protein
MTFSFKPAIIFLLYIQIFSPGGFAQSGYWQQHVKYVMDIDMNVGNNRFTGKQMLDYTNHSPDTLGFIWFHVWPNAYRNDLTLYSDQLLENGDTRFYFSSKEQKGYLNRLDFRVNGNTAVIQNHPEFIDIIKLILPKPLLPRDSISITTSFHLHRECTR